MKKLKVKSYSEKWIGVVYKGKMILCHPKSWMATFKIPIQDMSTEKLVSISKRDMV